MQDVNTLIYLAIILLLGFVALSIITAVVRSPGRALQDRFASLGTLSGKTKQEIIETVGPPHVVTTLPDGKTQLQWMQPGFQVTLVFDGDICENRSKQFIEP